MNPSRVFRFALVTAASSILCFAQGQPGGQAGGQQPPGGTPGGGAGGVGTPGGGGVGRNPIPGGNDRTQTPQIGDPNRTQFPEMQRPIFLSGKVVMQDGTPPMEPVTIERVCNGIARMEGYTDSKGRFSFQLGQNMGVMQDASVSSAADGFPGGGGGFPGTSSRGAGGGGFGGQRGFSERDLMGCELRASLPGFRSEVVNLAGRRMFDNPDVGTIVLRRLANVEGLTISATSMNAPKDARKAFDKGRETLKKKKIEQKDIELAQREFQKAVDAYPKYAAAWFELGRVYEQQKNVAEARKSYEQALAADAKYISPYLQLAYLSAQDKNWQEVADTTDRIVKLNPVDFPRAYFYNAVANYNLKKMDAAERSAREAQKLDTRHQFPQNDHLLGSILYEKQDIPGAVAQMKTYLKFAPNAQDAEMVRGQITQLEKMTEAKADTPATPQP